MKKSIVAILLIALMLCVSGCGSSNTSDTTVAAGASDNENTTLNHTQTSTTGTAKRENGVYGKILVLGNIEFTIPEGFQATIIDENTYMLTSKDYACSIGLYANSVQELDEEMTQIYLPLQHQAFVGEEETKYEESKLDGFAAKNLYEAAIKNTCGILIIAPLIVLYAFCQRFLVQGIERSGLTAD